MKKALINTLIVLGLVTGGLIGTSGPASAHVSICKGYTQFPVSNWGAVRGGGYVYCSVDAHNDTVQIQVEVKKSLRYRVDPVVARSVIQRGGVPGYVVTQTQGPCRGSGYYYTQATWSSNGVHGPTYPVHVASPRYFVC